MAAGAVGCLLLIGCMNLAVLLIARASSRAREMSVRVALGANGGRLRRQLLAEVLPLAVGGIAGGLILATWVLRALLPYLPPDTPRVASIGLNLPVVLFAAAVSLAVVACVPRDSADEGVAGTYVVNGELVAEGSPSGIKSQQRGHLLELIVDNPQRAADLLKMTMERWRAA